MDLNRAIRDTHLWDTRRGVGNTAQTPRLIHYSISHTFSCDRGSISNQHNACQRNLTPPTQSHGRYVDVYKSYTHCREIFSMKRLWLK